MSDDASVERPHAHPELAAGDVLASKTDRQRERDLLGIGLAMYFVILIGIVGVMLLLPALMPQP